MLSLFLFDMKQVFAICIILLFIGCTKGFERDFVPVKGTRFRLDVPRHMPYPDVYKTFNPLTEEGVALGRKLFYDPILSGNNQISCASCHHQDKGFSDGIALSNIGYSKTRLNRHAPALINMAWMDNGLFWDGGSTNLESQSIAPLAAHDEMYQDLYRLTEELKADAAYVKMFNAAYGSVSIQNMMKALAQFQRTFISLYSTYDDYLLGKGTLTAEEMAGMKIVKEKCQGCHSGVLFTDNLYHNNGLDGDFSNTNHEGLFQGRYRVTNDLSDLGAYKTPTLRNVMVSAPYMHDGRLSTIESVLEHYSSNVKPSPSLDPLLRINQGGVPGILLSQKEKAQIIAFLKTLTDKKFLENPALTAP